MESVGIEVAGALVKQVGHQIGDPWLVGRVLRAAAGEGIFHRDQRHGGVLDEPGLDAAGRGQMLDLGRRLRRRRCERGQRHAGGDEKRAGADRNINHERFSSRFAVVSLIR